jgi:hypothetical protein
MYKNFNITESEREQILNQHKEHGYKKSLNEQSLGNENVEDEKEELSFHMKNGVIANLLEKRGYKKVKESTNDGNVINIYDYVDGSYTIRVEIFTTKDKILGIVLYRGPEFGYPNTKVEENLIEKIFKREFISLNKGLGNFQDVLDKAKDILESTKKYNNAPGLPKSRMYEQSFEDYSTDMESKTQSNGINLQEQLLFIIEHLDGGHTEDSNVTPEKMVEVLKETIKQFVNPNDSITVRDWEKLYYSITNDMYA